nr:hypothetical protein StreXyl84_63600 [Streptomyces sp. Xyl84]
MEQRVLVAYGPVNGSTEKTAEAVAEVLRTTGITAEVLPARSVTDLDRYEAVVVRPGVELPISPPHRP